MPSAALLTTADVCSVLQTTVSFFVKRVAAERTALETLCASGDWGGIWRLGFLLQMAFHSLSLDPVWFYDKMFPGMGLWPVAEQK